MYIIPFIWVQGQLVLTAINAITVFVFGFVIDYIKPNLAFFDQTFIKPNKHNSHGGI